MFSHSLPGIALAAGEGDERRPSPPPALHIPFSVTLVASVLVGCSASTEGLTLNDGFTCDISSKLQGVYESPGASADATTGKCIDLARDIDSASKAFTFTFTRVDPTRSKAVAPMLLRTLSTRCRRLPAGPHVDADAEHARSRRQPGEGRPLLDRDGARLRRPPRWRADHPRHERHVRREGPPCTITGRDVALRRR